MDDNIFGDYRKPEDKVKREKNPVKKIDVNKETNYGRYSEPVAFTLTDVLIEKGYGLCTGDGHPTDSVDSRYFGIMRPRPDIKVKKKRFFQEVEINKRQNPIWLATLYLEANWKNSQQHTQWTMEVNGKVNVPEMELLAAELNSIYSIPIHIDVVSKELKYCH